MSLWTYRPTKDEIFVARLMARRRNRMNKGGAAFSREVQADPKKRPELLHFPGCIAEIAVSRMLNLTWSGCGRGTGAKPSADVGGFIEVRSTKEITSDLIVRQHDADRLAVLAQVNEYDKDLRIAAIGWEWIAEVKTREPAGHDNFDWSAGYQMRDAPYWRVKRFELRSMDALVGNLPEHLRDYELRRKIILDELDDMIANGTGESWEPPRDA